MDRWIDRQDLATVMVSCVSLTLTHLSTHASPPIHSHSSLTSNTHPATPFHYHSSTSLTKTQNILNDSTALERVRHSTKSARLRNPEPPWRLCQTSRPKQASNPTNTSTCSKRKVEARRDVGGGRRGSFDKRTPTPSLVKVK